MASAQTPASSPDPAAPSAENFGTVSIYAGSGDSIWMDGKLLRQSPMRGMVLSPGVHEFTLKTASGMNYSTNIALQAGDELLFRWDSETGEIGEAQR
jgi:hypothetical protein